VIVDTKRTPYKKFASIFLIVFEADRSTNACKKEVPIRVKGSTNTLFFRGGNLLCKSHCFEHISSQSLVQMIFMVDYNSNIIIYCIPQGIKKFSLLISCHHLANI
jgi:hypothetical protein